MSSNTKVYEEKMKSSVEHLSRELAAVRAGRANPAVLDKVSVDYYGAPTPIQQVASVAVAEARTLTITPWDRTLLRPISAASSWPRRSPNWVRMQRSPCATSAARQWTRPRQ